MPTHIAPHQPPATQLHRLIAEEWDDRMREDPLFATECGDHRFDARLPSVSVQDCERRLGQLRGFLSELHTIDEEILSADDRLNYAVFKRDLTDRIADYDFGVHLMPVTKQSGFHITFPDFPNTSPLDAVEDYDAYVTRLEGFRAYAEGHIGLMRAGIEAGYTQPRIALQGVESTILPHIVRDPVRSVFYEPLERFPDSISDRDQARLRDSAAKAILGSVVPGYEALLTFLATEYLPSARDATGASALPNGKAYYEHCVRKFTTLDITPAEVHEIGWDEVGRIRDDMAAVISKVEDHGKRDEPRDLHSFLEFLHTEPSFYVATPEALLKEVALILKRIDGQLPRLFNLLPRMPYGIREIPAYAAPKSTTAYYLPGAGDGRRAGNYYVNTYGLESRPLYEYEALSLHEAVPGHHLQLALQMELDLPNFRRFGGVTVFVEGWALYAERLGLEMGFYQDPYSDFGRLIFEMWRAVRLVVDTGIHYLGWTRQQAIDYMAENTALTLLNVTNEIDRYIGWPGQALAYKIGELKIRGLRRRAEEQLGSGFDVREFHRIVLEDGSIPLDVLESKAMGWIADQLQKEGENAAGI